MQSLSTILLFLVFIFYGSVYSQGLEQRYDIEFVRETTYEDTDKVFLGRISDVAVDSLGRVFISDVDQSVIHVYNPNSSYLTSMGRQGQGPGEFNQMSVTSIHSNHLFAIDLQGARPTRMNVYSLEDLSFSHTIDLLAVNQDEYEELEGYHLNRFYPKHTDAHLVGYIRFGTDYLNGGVSFIKYYLLNENARIISDQIFEQEDLRYLTYTYPSGYTVGSSWPFLRKSLFAVSDNNQIYSARTEDFLIQVYTPQGEYIREFQHPFDKKELTRDQLIDDSSSLGMRSMINDAELPETWPALESMFFDDENRLWVSTVVENEEVYQWWILQDSGDIITKFEWPRDEPIEVVRNGNLYTRETDKETGIQQIVRYRINMEENTYEDE